MYTYLPNNTYYTLFKISGKNCANWLQWSACVATVMNVNSTCPNNDAFPSRFFPKLFGISAVLPNRRSPMDAETTEQNIKNYKQINNYRSTARFFIRLF